MIRIQSDLTLATAESLLAEIHDKPGQSLSVPIHISRSASFGLAPILVQVVARWRELNDGHARVTVPQDVAGSLASRDRLASTVHGMAAIWLSDEVVTQSGDECKSSSLQSMSPYVIAMAEGRWRETIRGPHTLLSCFQPAKNEFLRSLYAKKERGYIDPTSGRETVTIRSQSEIADLLREIQDETGISNDRLLDDGQRNAIASILFQLFKNADVHTVTDENGNTYTKGMRGVMIRRVPLKVSQEIEAYAGADRKLSTYLTRQLTSGLVTSFVEISVFDTGPGLAARWLGSHSSGSVPAETMTLDQELEATQKCFELHATTQAQGGHGDGLAIAVRLLARLGAFMALRTGRISLYQDFASEKGRTAFDPQARFPSKRLSRICGTAYTICIPVRQA